MLTLHSSPEFGSVDRSHVYFTFASGRLAFDCVTCGAKCCRGFGYFASSERELTYQLGRRPTLKLFIDTTESGGALVRNLAPGCFFLGNDGRCGVQVDKGYDAKPETCRLFPFNVFRRVGRYIVVSPHPSLCPLEVVPGERTSNCSLDTILWNEMCAAGIREMIPEARSIESDVERLIELERKIVLLSEHYLEGNDIVSFVDKQRALTTGMFTYTALIERRLVGGGEPQTAAAMLRQTAELLGLSIAEVERRSPLVSRVVTAMTPYLRSRLLFADRKTRELTGPVAGQVSLGRLPNIMLATYLIAQLAELSGMESVTFQTVARLCAAFYPLLFVLAHLDTTLEWQAGCRFDLVNFPSHAQYRRQLVRVAQSLLASRQRQAPKSLAEIINFSNEWDGSERVQFVKYVAELVSGRVVPVGTPTGNRTGTIGGIKAGLQHWALNYADEETIIAYLERERARASGSVGADRSSI
jgi:Fe-S-cluster containining protein